MRISDIDSDRYKRSRRYRNTATTVLCCRECCSYDWISHVSHVLLLTDKTREALQLPLSHTCFTHCVFTIRLPSEYTGGNFAPAELTIMTVYLMGMVSVLLQFHAVMYLRRMAKFRSKIVACYTYSQKHVSSHASQLKWHALWAKLNHKNDYVFVYVLQM
jgi:hypothetical protein